MTKKRSECPLVSVVIPTHHRPQQVRATIRSVVEQDYDGVIEMIVVHDKEDPDPALSSADPRRPVRVTANDCAPGLAGARNSGLKWVSGELVASLDDDDVWMPEKVSAQVEAFEADPNALVVATGMVLHTPSDRTRVRIPPKEVITHWDLIHSRLMELHSSNLMMRREVFDLVGTYDEALVGIEDYDWLLRASSRAPIRTVRAPLLHVYRSTPLWRPERWRRIARAEEQILQRHPDLMTTRRSAAFHCGALAFAYAAGGNRRQAWKWTRRSLGHGVLHKRAVVAIAILGGLPVRWVQAGAGLLGRSI